MFFDPATNTVFDNLGWVDEGSLWLWEAARGSERRVSVPGTQGLAVVAHAPGMFRLIGGGDAPSAMIRRCDEPEIDLARLSHDGAGWRFEGHSALWGTDLPLLLMTASGLPTLILVDGANETARALDLGWYNHVNYDLGYQGVVDCLGFPDSGVVVVSVQRSSDLVLIDPVANSKVGTISLAGRRGNPKLQKLSASSFAAVDYDTFCVVDLVDGSVRISDVLQEPHPRNTAQFVGGYDWGPSNVVVARPFSRDVVRLDPTTLEIVGKAKVKGQPLKVCMISDNDFLTRDWKSGHPNLGAFGP